ncbi:MAG: septum site-determining protein MinC [Chloroflexota bacterium]
MLPKVEIKGIRDGLLVKLSDGEWSELYNTFLEHIDSQAGFLKGARLALDVGNQIIHASELGKLRDKLSEREISLWAVLSNSPTTEKNAQTLGLATRLSKPVPDQRFHSLDTSVKSGEPAVFVRLTFRSGYKLQYPGHVVILGDVNPGAEIIASGNIIVWGHLRGVVHAGAEGDEEAVVCALDLSPTQLRIADQIAITPSRLGSPQPEMASLKDGRVIAEPWSPRLK